MRDLCLRAVDAARHSGATRADARILRIREQWMATEDERITQVRDTESLDLGVRVIAGGAWGLPRALGPTVPCR